MPRQTGDRERRRDSRQSAGSSSGECRSDTSHAADAIRQSQRRQHERDSTPISGPITADSLTVGDENCQITADRRWQSEFDLRSQDALAGTHQPMLPELILGMPPLHDSLDADANIFAERLLARLRVDGVHQGVLIERL
jgi:hypothetical protein